TRPDVNCRCILNALRCANHPIGNISNVGEVTVLLAITPDLVRIHSNERLRYQGYHCVSFILALTICSKEPATYRLHPVLLPVGFEGHLTHEFRPAIFPISGRASRFERIRILLLEKQSLPVLRFDLELHRIDTCRACKTDPVSARSPGFVKNNSVEHHVG